VNFGRGQYVGLLLSDTEFNHDYNRVIGSDVSIRRGEHLTANGSFLSTHSQSVNGERSSGIGTQGSYFYSTRRFGFGGQLEHYDRGFRMDTAFINRVGVTRGWQYQELNFYPSHAKFLWIKRINPFFWFTAAEDRVQGGSEAFYLPAIRFNFTRAGFLRVDYANGHETYAGQEFDTGRVMADGNVQILRWLNIGGNVQRGPAIFYDPQTPFQGFRRTSGLRIGLQPTPQVNSNISYNFVTFKNRRTGEHVYDVHVLNLRNTYQFTPRFFIRAIAQFDSSRERVLADFLASYELSPGTVVHAGYGSLFGRAYEEMHFDQYMATARAFFFKASYRAHF
jgi:hypothetical protein